MSDEQNEIPVFVCYRQEDGTDAAAWLYTRLNELPITSIENSPRLNVYYDKGAPAIDDWTSIHRPFLERAKAFIFVATPGAFAVRPSKDGTDWVRMELTWWLEHRKTPPIVVATTSAALDWVPEIIKSRYPSMQCVSLRPSNWSDNSRTDQEEATIQAIVDGIRLSESGVRFEDVVQQRKTVRRMWQIVYMSLALTLLTLVGLVAVLVVNYQLSASLQHLADARTQINTLDQKIVDAQNLIATLPSNLKMSTFRTYAKAKTSWAVEVPFEVKVAVAIPISGFKDLVSLDAAEITSNGNGGSIVRGTMNKTEGKEVAVRILAFGFGVNEDGKLPDK